MMKKHDAYESDDETEEVTREEAKRCPVSQLYEAFVDHKQATAKRWARAVKAEAKFFDIARSVNESTTELMEALLGNREKKTGKPTLIDATQHSKRAFIMSDAGAVAQSIEDVDLDKLKTQIDKVPSPQKKSLLSKKLGWHNKGKGLAWNWQHVFFGNAKVGSAATATNKIIAKYQELPSINNLSNFHLAGVGDYGLDILPFINELTGKDSDSEMVLAKILLKFSATKQVISAKTFEKYDIELSGTVPGKRKEITKFNKIAFLVVVKEISRRIHHGPDIPNFPFGVAISQALRLLGDGHLAMKDVFAADANYGVFTGSKIMDSGNLSSLKKKFNKVFDLHDKKYAKVECNRDFIKSNPKAKLIPTREAYHLYLGGVLGGDSETEGDEYESSDQETLALNAKYL